MPGLSTKVRLYEGQKGRCFYCLRVLPKPKRGSKMTTLDHVIPKCNKPKVANNLVVCCKECNQKKSNKIIDPNLIKERKKIFKKSIDKNIIDVEDRLWNLQNK